MVYTKILLLLLASSCVREQDLKQSNTFYTRLFRPNEQLLGLIDNTPIKVYRIKIFNAELDQLEATSHIEASTQSNKLDIKLKSAGMKRVLIEALDAQSRIVYTAEGRYEQNGGFSYYAWPKRFRPYKLEKTKDLTLIFKLTDRTTSNFIDVTDDYSSIRDIFDLYQCTSCHGESHEINLRTFNKSKSLEFYTKVLTAVKSGKMPPEGLTKLSEQDTERLEDWLNHGQVEDLNQKARRALKKRSFSLEIVNQTDGAVSRRSLESDPFNTSYTADLNKLAFGSVYEFTLLEKVGEDEIEVYKGRVNTSDKSSGLIFRL